VNAEKVRTPTSWTKTLLAGVEISHLKVMTALMAVMSFSHVGNAQTSQTNEWTWMGGSSTMSQTANGYGYGQPGVYGTLGTPAPANSPGGRDGASSWTDSSGRLWLFGGDSFDSLGNYGWINDLWEFNPSIDEWTWIGGSNTTETLAQRGVYGTLGVPGIGNIPGARWLSRTWVDSGGNLWLFGGYGVDAAGNDAYLNDLWEFNPSTIQWTWIGGSNIVPYPEQGLPAVYGTLGTPAAGNTPGGREGALSWTDGSGNLWLFGGFGPIVDDMNDFNDLWQFNPSAKAWTWMGGSNTVGSSCVKISGATVCGQPGVYGTLGTPAANNIPGGRRFTTSWIDSSGHLWLFGGWGFDANGDNGYLNDLWEFNPSTKEWTWIGGSKTVGANGVLPGVYGTLGTRSATNVPGSRETASGWIDSSGNLWLFGGDGFDAIGQQGQLNDLWEFNTSSSQWAWMGGSSTVGCGTTKFGTQCGQPGVYGTLGTPAAGNVPGGRYIASNWTGGNGDFWLFGGVGYDANSDWGDPNDLWEYRASAGSGPGIPGPVVQTVSSILAQQTQTITITGLGFGTETAYNGDSAYIGIVDGSGVTWQAGYANSAMDINDLVTLSISSWTDTQIVLAGFTGSYGSDGWTLNQGDLLSVSIWNAQTGVGPGICSNIIVGAGATNCAINPAATPVISPESGTYTSAQTITISDATANAAIYYTTDGTTPTTASTEYTTAITVSATETIEAIAVAPGFSNSAVASATYTIKPSATGQLQFVTVTPCRIADTRNATGAFGAPELAAGVSRSFDVPQSACGIPAAAVAYSLNVTVVPILSLGYLTIWPTGEAQPLVSTLNSDGRVKANATITPAGANGGVSVYASDATQFVLDIDGYFVPAGTSTSGLEFYPLTPCRVADTRNATGALGGPSLTGGVGRAFPVKSSACGIPSTAKAYSLNVTAVPHSSLGYLTAWPSGQAQPVVSTLNSSTGAVTANAALVPAGTSGDVSIFVSDDADVVLDVNGYFAPPATGGLSLYTVTPCRVLDTRNGPGAFDGVLTVPVRTSTCAPPAAAQAYVLNGTVVPPSSLGYLTLWAAGGAQPYVSTLNASDGAVTSNMAIVPTANGSIDAFSTDSTNLILDLSGYFAP
jgi:N-acetylneuraminic acid mutarotase